MSNVAIGHTFRVDDLVIDSQDDAVIRAHLHGQRGVRGDRAQVDVACEVVRDRTVLLGNVEGGHRGGVSPADRAGTAVPALEGAGRGPVGGGGFRRRPVVPLIAGLDDRAGLDRGRVDRLRRVGRIGVAVRGNRAVVVRGAFHAEDGGLHRDGRGAHVVDVGFHGDHVVTGLQGRCGDEDLGEGGGSRGEVGRSVGAGRVADRAGTHAGAVHLDAVDVDDGTIVGQVLDVDALEGLRVGNPEVRAVVGRHGARALGGDLGRDRGVAVAQRCCAGRPRGIVERGLGPVLGGGAGVSAVVPGCTRFEEHRVGGIRLAGSRSGVDRGGRGAVALGVNGAHEVAVLAAARHLDAGGLGGGDRTIVAQDLVGHGVGNAFPREGHGGIVRRGGAQEGGCLRRDVVTVVVASKAAVPLSVRGIGVGEGEVAAHPQVAVVIGLKRPGAGLTERGELEGGPLEALTRGGVPRANPLDLVDARPGAVHRPDVHVLVGGVGAMAGAVDDAFCRDGAGLQVAAIAEHHGTGETLVAGRVVAEQ